jgi:hypothetical protein
MSKIALTGNALGSGTLTLAAPNTNTDRTLTLPDEAGTVLTNSSPVILPNGGPVFSAWGSTVQSCTSGANTKIILNNEVFDTASCFDSTTNYRFTPNVAGYYQISGAAGMVAGSASQLSCVQIFKNGSQYAIGSCSPAFTTIQNFMTVSDLVYMNGSTDYVELYIYHNFGSTWNTAPSQSVTWFTGALVRAA